MKEDSINLSSKRSLDRNLFRYPKTLLILAVFIAGLLSVSFSTQSSRNSLSSGMLSASLQNSSLVQVEVEPTVYTPIIMASAGPGGTANIYSVIFVSRQIPNNGSIYYSQGGTMPGVGPYSRFTPAAPGKLIIRKPDGNLRILINGSNPTPGSLQLIDVNAPDVSYDGKKIVFAGLPAGNYDSGPQTNPGAWRIYTINVDGTGLKQVTFSDRDNLNLSQFNPVNHFEDYDDFDPAWLPDDRIVFSSTRWPSLAMYNDSRTTNLYVVNVDGTRMHRITSERNGAERPLVDPLTGKIVYSRWWRNFRNAANDMSTLADPLGDGYTRHLGLVGENSASQFGGGPDANLSRNSWMLATINPDGTGLTQWAGISGIGSDAFDNHAYGGSFASNGSLYANFFPMHNLSEAAGFGGIRNYPRGPNGFSPFLGIADDANELVSQNPPSHRVFKGSYAADPEVLPNGRLIVSWAPDAGQDYGIYVVRADGKGLTLLYDNPGTTELRSRIVQPRPIPPIISDQATDVASLLPPLAQGPYDIDGTYTFDALNVYFNAPVDVDIVDAIPIGSAGTIRFFIDHQRKSYGFPERLDWPIFLEELTVKPDGSIINPSAPANVPLFEQIRSPQPGYVVPLTGANHYSSARGAAHVAGHNFGRPGEIVRCVGCHAGHSMIPVPENLEDAKWTNVAPSAEVAFSSLHPEVANNGQGLVDRKVISGEGLDRYWISQPGQNLTSQWVELTFPVPIRVRAVRLYGIPQESGFDVQVSNSSIHLIGEDSVSLVSSLETSGLFQDSGTDFQFEDVLTRSVRIEFNSTNGEFVGLGEIEVIGMVPLEE